MPTPTPPRPAPPAASTPPTPITDAGRIEVTCFDLRHHDDDTFEWTVVIDLVGAGGFVMGDVLTTLCGGEALHEALHKDRR